MNDEPAVIHNLQEVNKFEKAIILFYVIGCGKEKLPESSWHKLSIA
jgi:hypothetical protein